jgi:hypothetical protein
VRHKRVPEVRLSGNLSPNAKASDRELAEATLSIRWDGSNGVFVAVMDSTQKAQLAHPFCQAKSTCVVDLKPGEYYLVMEAAGFSQPIPVSVAAGATNEIVPPVGVVTLHWNGANGVFVAVMDSTQKVQLARPFCQAKTTCTQDMKSGRYYLNIEAPGVHQAIPLEVIPGQKVELSR